jgi:hypothetical protein
MDYQKHYDLLIEKRKNRELIKNEYYENHHIVPKCIGGSNTKDNLIKLTAREHFIAHWLLHRIYPKNNKLAFAFYLMSGGFGKNENKKIFSSIAYQESKIARGKAISENNKKYKTGHIKSEETLLKLSNALKGKNKTEEHRKRISDSLKGRKLDKKHKENLSESLRNYDWTSYVDRNKKISDANKGLNNGRARTVCMFDLSGENLINEFDTMKDALDFINIDHSVSKTTFFRRLTDNKQLHGYIWKFKN